MTSTGAGHVRVVHMTSVHQPDDLRIFAKECRALAELGYDVHLVAASASGEVVRDGVHVRGVGVPASSGRLVRMTRTVAEVLRIARALDADVYHLHDPELVPAGLVLARDGKQVVYDAHEDLPADILDKAWIPRRSALPRWSQRRLRSMTASPGIAVAPSSSATIPSWRSSMSWPLRRAVRIVPSASSAASARSAARG